MGWFEIEGPIIITCQKCGVTYLLKEGHICVPPIAVMCAVGAVGYAIYQAIR